MNLIWAKIYENLDKLLALSSIQVYVCENQKIL